MLASLLLALALGGGSLTARPAPDELLPSVEAQALVDAEAAEEALQLAARQAEGRKRRQARRAARRAARDAAAVQALTSLASASGPQVTASGATSNTGSIQGSISPTPYSYTVTIPKATTGTGYKERFMVFAPSQDKPRAMLVVFHKFGVSELDAWVNTTFFQEAWQRGWYVVAPLSASGVHFGAPLTQTNTEVVLDWMTANFNVRPDRIYGVGFSMGGGMALSYAARHLDPTKPMFAGIVNHTGGIALSDTYLNEPSSQFIFDFWFGTAAPGSASLFRMAVSSMLEFNPSTLAVNPSTDMARNLEHMPVKIFRVVDDPLAYLTIQSDVLATHLASQGTPLKVEIVPGGGHAWSNLSEFKTVNWLAKKRLTLPLSGRVLADRAATFYYFTITQIAADAFSAFDFDLDLVGNTLTIRRAVNLTRVEVETLEAGLDPLSILRLDMGTSDGFAVEYVLQDWASSPSAVTRDLVGTVAFVHDPVAETLTLQELDGGIHVWEITP